MPFHTRWLANNQNNIFLNNPGEEIYENYEQTPTYNGSQGTPLSQQTGDQELYLDMNDAPQVAPRVDSQLEVYDEVQEGGGKVNSAFYEEAEQALYDDINNGAQDGKHLSSAGVRDSRGEEVYAEANEEEYMNPDCLQGQGEPEETYEVPVHH
ncbi:hypothetical protein EB796_001723 [Bugula neritina]|uniref:Uncharacterized protein n=1 Tax=Bugula neritina TaxID=10212 RepID=A0A7J7KP59_BUGNE|nr:hypothetical protein EB796_001723 [Bugula neritina]